MSLCDKSLKNKLARYPKADIIDAVCSEFNADHIVSNMLRFLRDRTTKRLMDEEHKAFKAQDNAGHAYIDWHNDMIKRFGDGKEVKFSDIPDKELDKGIKLAKVWDEARQKSEKACDRMNCVLGIPKKKETPNENT